VLYRGYSTPAQCISQSPSISKTLQVVIVSRIIAERQANPVFCAATATHPAQCSPKFKLPLWYAFFPIFGRICGQAIWPRYEGHA
jgi:hypothetical protein